MNSKPGRLAVGVVGAGRVGAVLGSALRADGHEIVGVSGASEASRERADALLPGVPVLDPVEVARRSDLVLVTVPDDALAEVVAWIAQQGGFRPGQLVLHTSGRHGIDVLAPALAAGAIPLAVHPAMTFTGTSLDLARLVGAPFAVTAAAPVQPIGQALVVEFGGEPVIVPDASRAAYHAALTHASNHLVTLIAQAQEILLAAGVVDTSSSSSNGRLRAPDSSNGRLRSSYATDGTLAHVERAVTASEEIAAASQLLGPLTRASLEGALSSGGLALTGPVSRGDAGTVAGHLAALEGLVGPDGADLALPSYCALTDATAVLAEQTGRIDGETAARIRRLVADGAGGVDGVAAGAGAVRVVRTIAEVRAARRRMWGEVAIVPTMGALHAGHLALVRAARQVARHVVVTIFVNPTQFGDPADLAAYPNTLDADIAALSALGLDAPDLVFAPSAAEIYPTDGPRVTVDPGPLADVLEGASRPGHFAGVLTVVAKLFNIVQPDVAVFGEKDAQQLALVRRMVRDLDFPLWVLSVPTVREADGLALSSRNARLSPEGRQAALALSRAVVAAQRLAAAGAGEEEVVRGARAELDVPGVAPDYAAILDESDESESIVVAAVVDGVRLIDTAPLR